MKTVTLTLSVVFAGVVSPALASVPLTQQIGTVPPDIYHAMSGNFSAAHGYTNDKTLLVPAAKVSKKFTVKPINMVIEPEVKKLAPSFQPAAPLFPSTATPATALPTSPSNRTVPNVVR